MIKLLFNPKTLVIMGTFAFTREEFTKIQKDISKNLDLKENFEVYDKLFDEKADSQIEYLHKNGM